MATAFRRQAEMRDRYLARHLELTLSDEALGGPRRLGLHRCDLKTRRAHSGIVIVLGRREPIQFPLASKVTARGSGYR